MVLSFIFPIAKAGGRGVSIDMYFFIFYYILIRTIISIIYSLFSLLLQILLFGFLFPPDFFQIIDLATILKYIQCFYCMSLKHNVFDT